MPYFRLVCVVQKEFVQPTRWVGEANAVQAQRRSGVETSPKCIRYWSPARLCCIREFRDNAGLDGPEGQRPWSLLTTGSGRFPVRGCTPLLSRIMDDQGERTTERRTGDIQFHWSIRLNCHGFPGPNPVSASRRLQTLLSRQHVPAFGTGVCMDSGTVAGPHDSVRENRGVALCCGKLQRPDDGDGVTPPRRTVSSPEF